MEGIGHFDADAFFASVEQAADARLRGRPIAVGGGRRGVVASASYEARRYGVCSAMPVRKAKELCPELVVVRGQFELYEQFSERLFGYLEGVSPYVERSSIDEGYVDGNGLSGGMVERMHWFRREVQGALKVGVSCGVARGKRISKIAGALHKPGGFVVVPRGSEAAFLEPLEVGRLPGLGPVRVNALEAIGLRTVGQLRSAGAGRLQSILGKETGAILSMARGEDDSRVELERPAAKSRGEQHSFEEDEGDEERVEGILLELLEHQLRRMRKARELARRICLVLRYSDYEEVQVCARLAEPDNIAEAFIGELRRLLKRAWQRRVRLRQVRLQLSQFYREVYQGDLFEGDRRDRWRQLARVRDELVGQYGDSALCRAVELQLRQGGCGVQGSIPH